MVVDPQRTVDGCAQESSPSTPSVENIQLLVPVVTKEDRKGRVFGCEKEYKRELGDGKEAGAVWVVDELGVQGHAE